VLRGALRVVCCVLRVACCVLRVACCVLRGAWCVLRVACCVLRVACCALATPYGAGFTLRRTHIHNTTSQIFLSPFVTLN
jgi:hypothetical protein